MTRRATSPGGPRESQVSLKDQPAPLFTTSYPGSIGDASLGKTKKAVKREPLEWGAVKVVAGVHKGRIGYLDDDDIRGGIVYFGDFFYAPTYYIIPKRYLAQITTDDLMRRREELFNLIGFPGREKPYGRLESADEHIEHLTEYAYVESELNERMFVARLTSNRGKRVFISHSSKDKKFATWLSVDLANRGHDPWLDSWKIRAGESIPGKIGEGIRDCDFLIVVLSKSSVASNWVEREWQAKYWSEVSSGKVQVIPALVDNCIIPPFLQAKKYADFRSDYSHGLEDVLVAMVD